MKFKLPPSSALYTSAFLIITCFAGLSLHAEPTSAKTRWENDLAAFEAREATSPSPRGSLLFVGSSSIRMWDLEVSWPGLPVINNGFGGSLLKDSLAHFDRLILPYEPAAIILYAGDNDMNKGSTSEEVTANFRAFADLVSNAKPGVPLIFVAIKPSIARWNLWPGMKQANRAIAEFCGTRENLYFADIAGIMLDKSDGPPEAEWFKEDGLHLSPIGYLAWTKVVSEQLKIAGVLE